MQSDIIDLDERRKRTFDRIELIRIEKHRPLSDTHMLRALIGKLSHLLGDRQIVHHLQGLTHRANRIASAAAHYNQSVDFYVFTFITEDAAGTPCHGGFAIVAAFDVVGVLIDYQVSPQLRKLDLHRLLLGGRMIEHTYDDSFANKPVLAVASDRFGVPERKLKKLGALPIQPEDESKFPRFLPKTLRRVADLTPSDPQYYQEPIFKFGVDAIEHNVLPIAEHALINDRHVVYASGEVIEFDINFEGSHFFTGSPRARRDHLRAMGLAV